MEPSRSNSTTVFDSFIHTYQLWLGWLYEFDRNDIAAIPTSGGWSIGQLYLHLVNETNWYLDQVIECMGNNDNQSKNMSESAKVMFANNSFPDMKIKGNSAVNDSIPQPLSKEAVIDSFELMESKANET